MTQRWLRIRFDAPRAFPEPNASLRQSDSPVAGNLATFAKCHEWLAPEVLEARRRQFGVPHRVLDILVPEVIL
jgi:hypothetical protein